MRRNSKLQDRQTSGPFNELELKTLQGSLRQNTEPCAQDGAAARNNQSHPDLNNPVRTVATPEEAVEVPSHAPADDLRTRGQGLHRYLKRHHITGIAFSGTLGVGILVYSGQIIGLAGGLGALVSFIIAAVVVISVMITVAEMVSVIPYWGLALYPHRFVGPSLGNTVGVVYWFAQATSLATLIVTGALICTEDDANADPHKVAAYSVIPLLVIPLVNAFSGIKSPYAIHHFKIGIIIDICSQLYGNLEWVIKWLKIILLLGLDITVLTLIHHVKEYNFSSKFDPTRVNGPKLVISGPLGSFLSVWTSITLAVFAFVGVEIVVVTTVEAAAPVRDLPRASQRVSFGTSLLYVVSIFIVSLAVASDDPSLQPLHASTAFNTNSTGLHSPFIIAINNANLKHGSAMVKATRAGLVLAAWTTADISWFKNHPGKANTGGTPLWAIGITYAPSLLALLSLKAGDGQLILAIFSTITTISVLCVYIAECYAFICFKLKLKEFVDRDGDDYRRNYFRVPRQPFCAWFGIVSCTLLVTFNGWYLFWQIHHRQLRGWEAFGRLVGAYGGVAVFIIVFLINKLILKPAKKDYNFTTSSRRERDEEVPPGIGRYKAWAWRFFEFIK